MSMGIPSWEMPECNCKCTECTKELLSYDDDTIRYGKDYRTGVETYFCSKQCENVWLEKQGEE